MFRLNDHVNVNIRVGGEIVAVPGICTTDEYVDYRVTRNGSRVRADFVDVITFHDITASQSRDGKAKSFYKSQAQSAAFMDLRTKRVAKIDDLTGPQLVEAVRKSLREAQLLRPVDRAPASVGAGTFSAPMSAGSVTTR